MSCGRCGQVEDAVDEDARRDDDFGVDVADVVRRADTSAMVSAAAVAITGPKLRAVLRYTRFPARSPMWAPMTATSPRIGNSST